MEGIWKSCLKRRILAFVITIARSYSLFYCQKSILRIIFERLKMPWTNTCDVISQSIRIVQWMVHFQFGHLGIQYHASEAKIF